MGTSKQGAVATATVDTRLAGTPYVSSDLPDAHERFARVAARAEDIRQRAIRAAAGIEAEAAAVLPQFEIAVRSDLVSESDRMEGIATSAREVRALVAAKRELLEAEVGSFIRFIRDDARLVDSLGLYRAYAIADDWARAEQRPREFELRGLHSLVMPSLTSSGRYKSAPNEIGGSSHVPTSPWDVGREMTELASWFATGTGAPALDAAVVHAWLAHIHPFDDGNGRMARLLANLALIQSAHPPLLLRSGADRGQYLDALVASDDGDILPLYDLFVSSLRRVVLTMEKPNYVESKIRGDLLRSATQRYERWLAMVTAFAECIRQKLKRRDWDAVLMGYPSQEHFDLLEQRSRDGNSWFLKLRRRGEVRWLLWFGYRSTMAVDILGGDRNWPSIFVGERTEQPGDSVHPFETQFDRDDVPLELIFTPGSRQPALIRKGYATNAMHVDEAAAAMVKALCR